jgi:hypothetical protein
MASLKPPEGCLEADLVSEVEERVLEEVDRKLGRAVAERVPREMKLRFVRGCVVATDGMHAATFREAERRAVAAGTADWLCCLIPRYYYETPRGRKTHEYLLRALVRAVHLRVTCRRCGADV